MIDGRRAAISASSALPCLGILEARHRDGAAPRDPAPRARISACIGRVSAAMSWRDRTRPAPPAARSCIDATIGKRRRHFHRRACPIAAPTALRLVVSRLAPDQRRRERQRIADVVRPAMTEIMVELRHRLRRHRRKRRQPRIGPVVARQRDEHDALRARHVGDALEPVAPVVEPAERAHDDGARLPDHAVNVEIDRHRMPQPLEAREPQARQRIAPPCHAAASAERSLSLNDSTTMSAGVCPRSTAASISSRDSRLRREQMHAGI